MATEKSAGLSSFTKGTLVICALVVVLNLVGK